VLIALYENDTPFDFRMLAPGDERAAAEHENLWPLKRIPVLVDEGRTVVEASIIVEHLGLHHPGPVRLIPEPSIAMASSNARSRVCGSLVPRSASTR